MAYSRAHGQVPDAAARGPVFALRPLELKQYFDFAIRLYRLNFAPTILVNAIVQAPASIAAVYGMTMFMSLFNNLEQSARTGAAPGFETFEPLIGSGLILAGLMIGVAFYQLLAAPVGMLITSKLAAQSLFGRPWTLEQAWAFMKRRYWTLQVSMATYFLPLLLLSLVMLIPAAISSGLGRNDVTLVIVGIALAGIFAGGCATFVMFYRYFPAISGAVQACEEPPADGMLAQGVWCLKRAAGLMSGMALRAFGLLLIFQILLNTVQRGVGQTAELFSYILRAARERPDSLDTFATMMSQNDPATIGITMIAASIAALVFQPLVVIFQLLLYVDARFRKEGLDILHSLGLVSLPE
jgi:hypothetical protein